MTLAMILQDWWDFNGFWVSYRKFDTCFNTSRHTLPRGISHFTNPCFSM